MMKLVRARSLFGCSQYHSGPAAYFLLTCRSDEAIALSTWCAQDWGRFDALLQQAAGFHQPVSQPVSQLVSKISTAGSPGEISRCGACATLAEAIRRTAAAAGLAVGPACHLAQLGDGGYELTIPSEEPEILAAAGAIAVDGLGRLCSLATVSVEEARELRERLLELRRRVEVHRRSPTEAAILAVARERGVPVVRFDRWPFITEEADPPEDRRGQIQLGQGVYGRRLRGAAILPIAAATREQLGDRVAMHRALRAAGVPVPTRDPEFTNLNTVRRTIRAAERIGYPAVLKPRYRRQPGGAAINLPGPEAVATAYATASRNDMHVVIERQVAGWPYKILVIGREVVAVAQVAPPDAPGACAQPVPVAALAPELIGVVIRAAQVFGLEVAQVGIVSSDPAAPLERSDGAVIGVDFEPDLGLYRADHERLPLRAARRLVSHLFPDGRPSRVPIVAVTGSAGKTTSCRMVGRILEETGRTVGLACTDGVYVGRILVKAGIFSGISGALQVLSDSRVQVAVLEVSRGTLIEKGLGYEWATAAACTKVQPEHLGLNGVETLSDMARVKGLVIERASAVAVVNAQDPLCMQMLGRARADRIALVSADPHADALQQPLDAGRLAVVLEVVAEQAQIRLWDQAGKHSLIRVDEIPTAWGGAAAHNVENAMFAVAISAGLGVPHEAIRRGLRGFQSSPEDSPNRLNSYHRLPFAVILDRAGTTPGYQALADFVDRLAPAGRKLVGFFGTGDRRDQDLRAVAARLANSFDYFVCFDGSIRGRRPMEVPELMRATLLENGVADADIVLCTDLQEAVQCLLASAKPGEFVVITSGTGLREVLGWLDQAAERAPAGG
ncbi:MAG: hypothetical protein EA400_16120 [Chromatiaceae bacterium]|nr:MAG: hypothetical protein EA400_16120 [Chromatiaceae bacterium]